MATKPLQSVTFPDLPNKYTVPVIDNTLSVTGAAADAKKTGDELADLKADISESVGDLKNAFNILSTDGTVRFDASLFEYGWLWQGGISKYQSGVAFKSRIVTTNIQVAPYDVTLVPLSGFSIAVALYSNADEWTSGGNAKSTKTVSLVKGQHFRVCIIKTTEDTSEVADIQTYVNNVSVSSPVSDTITTASDNKHRIDVLAKNYISQSETASTLMSQRFGVVIGIDGLTLVKGKTYTVSLTPVTPIDLQTDSNVINPIIYKSDDTVGIRLGSVDRPNNVFNKKWTTSFIPTDTLVNCKLGAYVVLPSVADYKIVFEIADTTEEVLVEDVNALKSGTALVPSYYESYLNSRLSTIWSNDILIGNSGDSFMFITDMHDQNNYVSPALAKYIMDKSAVGRVVFGGDYINEPSSKSIAIQYLEQRISKCRVSERAVFLRGNHETNPYGTGQLTPGEVYGIINKRIERYADTNGNNYYYFDNESQKIRYLILDTGESGDIDTTQETFVHDATSQLDNTWTVIILSHMAIYANGVDVRDNVQKYDVVDKVISAISGTSAKIACWVCGHTHKDLSYNTTNFPIICVTCDANGAQASIYTSDNRNAGTSNERAFDVFHVDTNTKKVYVTRIGGGQANVISTGNLTDNDREFSYS